MDETLIRGNTPEQREASRKALLRSEARKAKLEKIRVVVPTIPISVSTSGPVVGTPILKHFFPMSGEIVKAVSSISGCKNVEFSITIKTEYATTIQLLTIGDGTRFKDVSFDIEEGALFSLEVNNVELRKDELIENVEISLSFIFRPDVDKTNMIKLT